MSLPSRERGLKHHDQRQLAKVMQVAPFTGAWIETNRGSQGSGPQAVAPFTGAWIETTGGITFDPTVGTSLPSRERGLKHNEWFRDQNLQDVAPFTGAWIETDA